MPSRKTRRYARQSTARKHLLPDAAAELGVPSRKRIGWFTHRFVLDGRPHVELRGDVARDRAEELHAARL